jgi:3-oxoacyl-[acyl-carrier protein] reductase
MAWATGELSSGDKMLKYSAFYTNTELALTQPMGWVSDMRKAITGRVLIVDNGAFL